MSKKHWQDLPPTVNWNKPPTSREEDARETRAWLVSQLESHNLSADTDDLTILRLLNLADLAIRCTPGLASEHQYIDDDLVMSTPSWMAVLSLAGTNVDVIAGEREGVYIGHSNDIWDTNSSINTYQAVLTLQRQGETKRSLYAVQADNATGRGRVILLSETSSGTEKLGESDLPAAAVMQVAHLCVEAGGKDLQHTRDALAPLVDRYIR